MWIIIVVLIGVAVYFVLQNSSPRGSYGSTIETPLDILKKRYANGEINAEEFARMKKDLDS